MCLLKPTVTAEVAVQQLPPYVTEELELQVFPEEVLAIRGDSKQTLEVLVKWKNMPPCENSWESLSKMTESCPEFHLEDKVNFEGGGVDTNREWKGHIRKNQNVYKRKNWKPVTWGPQAHTIANRFCLRGREYGLFWKEKIVV